MNLKKIQPLTTLIILHVLVLALAVGFLFKRKGKATDTEKIVVIPIEGVISFEAGALARGMSVDSIVETLKNIGEKDDIKAVVLRINSPGGSVGAVQEIHRALKKLKDKKKVIVSSFGDVSASGGYYVASAGDGIIANPGTLTGSIGVIAQFPDLRGLLQKVGVSFNTIKSGSMKDMGSPFRNMTDAEKKYFTTLIDDSYGQFFAAVAEGRKMDEKTLKPLADGRVFTGRQALELKLVDELGGEEEAIEMAKRLAGIEKKKPRIIHEKGRPSLERLLGILGKSSILAPLTLSEFKILYLMQ